MAKKMGRPEIPFDWTKLDAVLQYKPSLEDCAEIMNCHHDTIEKKIRAKFDCSFSAYRDKKMSTVRLSLVQKAIHMAKSGDRTMLIFCLKNLCGWNDVYQQEINQTNTEVKRLVIHMGEDDE